MCDRETMTFVWWMCFILGVGLIARWRKRDPLAWMFAASLITPIGAIILTIIKKFIHLWSQ